MYMWNVFLERAEGSEARRMIGSINADTRAAALHKAAEYFEYPEHDLVVEYASSIYGQAYEEKQ